MSNKELKFKSTNGYTSYWELSYGEDPDVCDNCQQVVTGICISVNDEYGCWVCVDCLQSLSNARALETKQEKEPARHCAHCQCHIPKLSNYFQDIPNVGDLCKPCHVKWCKRIEEDNV